MLPDPIIAAMRRIPRLTWGLLVALVIAAAGPSVAGAPLSDRGAVNSRSPEGTILYRKGRDLHLVDADGGRQRNLTVTPGRTAWGPQWSPDGSMIAFLGPDDVRVVTADGGEPRGLTTSSGEELDWSPDGKKIVFEDDRRGHSEIFLVDIDGTGRENLTRHREEDECPAWSPDGGAIAFTRQLGQQGPRDIYVMRHDGGGQRRLTRGMSAWWCPTWSPDGSQILFTSYVGGDDVGLYVMNTDGSRLRRLVREAGDPYDIVLGDPVWSPNGQSILFTSFRDGNYEIYRISPTGHGLRNVTRQPARQDSPAWSPDGRRIAFVSFIKENDSNKRRGEIHVMSNDGTGQRDLTPAGGRSNHDLPAWSPAG